MASNALGSLTGGLSTSLGFRRLEEEGKEEEGKEGEEQSKAVFLFGWVLGFCL